MSLMASVQPLPTCLHDTQSPTNATHSLHAKVPNLSDQNQAGPAVLTPIPKRVNAPLRVLAVTIEEIGIHDKVASSVNQTQQGTQISHAAAQGGETATRAELSTQSTEIHDK
ncbi:hypothetical protein F0562_001717 [Nyssa sinensis]|uniref:Uncharacterized protein n=1 Tax=Nyssa sinensis TaxID=561372 RepID=A0A5J5C3S0_9ASTE|nr:hypothetical protein F0562_001717 [Nyssa sinensis]